MITRVALVLLGLLTLGVVAAFVHAHHAATNDVPRSLCALGGVCYPAFGVSFATKRHRFKDDGRDELMIGLPPLDTMDALYAR
ncbi:MAG: hypothetical protein JXK05_07060 [Campylobacterales bacterium]|nr:hypothetical protein [Campylobacterales bacterium]